MSTPLRLHYPSFLAASIMETIWNSSRSRETPQKIFDDHHMLPTWEINLAQNMKRSGLVGLPDELLLQIMLSIDKADLYTMRQVSYTFWRIHRGRDFLKDPSRGGFPHDNATITRAKRDAFCSKCLHLRIVFSYWVAYFGAPLDCHCCNTSHRLLQFSSRQRPMYPRDGPQCIISGASIEICRHKTVSLIEIRRGLSQAGNEWAQMNRNRSGVYGPHSINLESCSVCKETSSRFTDKQHNLMIKPPSIKGSAAISSMIRTIWKHNRNPSYPRLHKWFELEWILPIMISTAKHQVVTDSFLSNKLEAFELNFDSVFCPHITRKDLLRPFDPSICHCIPGSSRPRVPINTDDQDILHGCLSQNLRVMADPEDAGYTFAPSNCHWIRCAICLTKYSWLRHREVVYLQRYSPSFGSTVPKHRSSHWYQIEAANSGIKLAHPHSYGANRVTNDRAENTF